MDSYGIVVIGMAVFGLGMFLYGLRLSREVDRLQAERLQRDQERHAAE